MVKLAITGGVALDSGCDFFVSGLIIRLNGCREGFVGVRTVVLLR
jgi:hypothetical protein